MYYVSPKYKVIYSEDVNDILGSLDCGVTVVNVLQGTEHVHILNPPGQLSGVLCKYYCECARAVDCPYPLYVRPRRPWDRKEKTSVFYMDTSGGPSKRSVNKRLVQMLLELGSGTPMGVLVEHYDAKYSESIMNGRGVRNTVEAMLLQTGHIYFQEGDSKTGGEHGGDSRVY
jgi:hypothetical protein